jgi:hypothetical protein
MSNKFEKLFKNRTIDTQVAISQSVKNGFDFICYLADMKISTENMLTYPSYIDTNKWMNNLFSRELKPKVYNKKALEAMEKRGITPPSVKKEVLTIVLASSETHIHVGFRVPCTQLNKFNKCDFLLYITDGKSFHANELICFQSNYNIFRFETDSPLKEVDDAKKRVFEFLESSKIYVEEE